MERPSGDTSPRHDAPTVRTEKRQRSPGRNAPPVAIVRPVEVATRNTSVRPASIADSRYGTCPARSATSSSATKQPRRTPDSGRTDPASGARRCRTRSRLARSAPWSPRTRWRAAVARAADVDSHPAADAGARSAADRIARGRDDLPAAGEQCRSDLCVGERRRRRSRRDTGEELAADQRAGPRDDRAPAGAEPSVQHLSLEVALVTTRRELLRRVPCGHRRQSLHCADVVRRDERQEPLEDQ